MKRSRPASLIPLALGGAILGFLLELISSSTGRPIIVPPITLPLTLVVVAAIVLVFAIPIRRAVTGASKHRVDPFQAMRVAVLAKASSLSGALLAGTGLGVVLYLVTRTVVPSAGSVWLAVAMATGAAILLAAGLVAEYLCTLPPDDATPEPGGAHA